MSRVPTPDLAGESSLRPTGGRRPGARDSAPRAATGDRGPSRAPGSDGPHERRRHPSGRPAPDGPPGSHGSDHPAVGRLLSVNVGLPKNVPWQGKTVFTGVFKDPVAGPRRVGRLNIDGDGQGDLAGHGGEQRAVFVYQIDSYRYWERELGRDDFVYGQFGENLTVEGLGDDEVCIGDRYRIGTAVFEVTQPRVTCYRVGIRMNDPRIPALLVSHHRPGFYFRVLDGGRGAGGRRNHQARLRARAGARRRGRRAALPARAPAPAIAASASNPRAQPGLAGLVPGPARRGAGQRQRRTRGEQSASRLARVS